MPQTPLDIDDDFDDEDLSPQIVDQIRRLQLQMDLRESARRDRRHRGYRTRRRIEEWSERRALRDSVDYLESELEHSWRSEHAGRH